MGLLSKGHVIEADRSSLVGEFIGQTAPKVKKMIDAARGGILFIDEAYSLARKGDDDKDFGKEVIEVIIKEMSDGKGDIAIMALTVDILNDVVKPEGNPKIIKNSLYALSQAAKFFGADLFPVKIPANTELSSLVPFIAHLNPEHYILVTRVTEDKVYYSEEHKEEFLPKDVFLSKFSGYALTSILPEGLKV